MNDIIGKKFNCLTVIEFHHKKQYKKNNTIYRTTNYWLCKCDCGNTTVVSTENLKNGNVKSCGCLKHKSYNQKHNLSNTRLYHIWCGIKARCYNALNPAYSRYGSRGIKVCNEWLVSFINFYNWAIDNKYNDNLTLDRINNNGNYEPTNCRWATPKQQANNTRKNKLITFKSKTYTLSQWANLYNIDVHLLRERIKYNWDFEKALTTPADKYKNRADKLICYQGEYKTKEEWLKILKIHPTTFYRRLKKQTN